MNESFINEKQCLWRKLSDCVNAKSRTICLMSFFLLLSTFIPVLAQDAKVSLNKQNVPLSAILDEIETKTNYLFVVNSKVNTKREVSVKAKQEPVKNVLEHLFKGMDVAFSQEGSHIIIGSKDNTRVTKRTLTGVVKDENGETLINANVMIKGTTIGTVTDFDGKFSLTGDFLNGDVLVFRSLGMKPQEMTIGTKNNFLIVMTEDTKLLNEVVVTAMGIEKKASSLTYATQQVAGKELTRAKDANFINSLQGKASGLVITPNASGAGGSSKLLLRGNSSILGNNSPLIVLDGVPMADRTGNQIGDALLSGGTGKDGGDGLSNINPDDIASITVLKGANAAALYGSSAANGVLIITTKQGTEGRVNIDV
ncbi:MAG: TonB-dependent receptor plug domain-containing protein, partial [Bacteroidales bacterium]